jgi:hypothetical protein
MHQKQELYLQGKSLFSLVTRVISEEVNDSVSKQTEKTVECVAMCSSDPDVRLSSKPIISQIILHKINDDHI